MKRTITDHIVAAVYAGAVLTFCIWLLLAVAGNQPYENIVPCTTDTDCEQKNPNVEFSLD